jgi:hypothetical protein
MTLGVDLKVRPCDLRRLFVKVLSLALRNFFLAHRDEPGFALKRHYLLFLIFPF